MAKVGEALAFSVVAKNKAGRTVADTGITVTATLGTATVSDDGKVGSFIGTDEGDATLVATDGKLTSAAVTVTVTDETPATLEVVLA